jgi:hypothetical protein
LSQKPPTVGSGEVEEERVHDEQWYDAVRTSLGSSGEGE